MRSPRHLSLRVLFVAAVATARPYAECKGRVETIIPDLSAGVCSELSVFGPLQKDGVAALVGALSTSSSALEEVSLKRAELDDEAVRELAGALATSGVRELDLSGNRIGDRGAVAIAAAFGGARLEDLDLSGNHIGDGGATALAELLDSLHELDLEDNEVGDSGAVALAQRASMRSRMPDLDLDGNMIGEKGASHLRSSGLKVPRRQAKRPETRSGGAATPASEARARAESAGFRAEWRDASSDTKEKDSAASTSRGEQLYDAIDGLEEHSLLSARAASQLRSMALQEDARALRIYQKVNAACGDKKAPASGACSPNVLADRLRELLPDEL